eukprot:m.70540 g.70540  ORF g.70540 m.70540 type:complete len:1110 (-) comp13779_c1_seq1:178-3507(-)
MKSIANGKHSHVLKSKEINGHQRPENAKQLNKLIDAKLRAQENVWTKRVQFEPARDLQAATGGLTSTTQEPAAQNDQKKGSSSLTSPSHVHRRDPDGFIEPNRQLFNEERISVSWKATRPVGAGLGNLGNTCYLNATLQCLTYTPALANLCLSSYYQRTHAAQPGFDAMKIVELHVVRALSNPKKSILPKPIINHLRQINKHFRHHQQQDAHEFFICLLDAMQKALLAGYSKLDRLVQETTLVHHIFGGYLRSTIQCGRCHHNSNTFEAFLDISLDIKTVNSLYKALHSFTRKEQLFTTNSYKCEKCKQQVTATKQLTLHRLPNVLCFQLKRFSFSSDFGSKLRHKVSYPARLNVHDFLSPSVKQLIKRDDCNYTLYAVLVHAGYSLSSGHYACYVKGPNNVWYSVDDDDLRFSKEQEALDQAAYMLFYTRATRKPPASAYYKPQPEVVKAEIAKLPVSQQQQEQQQAAVQHTKEQVTRPPALLTKLIRPVEQPVVADTVLAAARDSDDEESEEEEQEKRTAKPNRQAEQVSQESQNDNQPLTRVRQSESESPCIPSPTPVATPTATAPKIYHPVIKTTDPRDEWTVMIEFPVVKNEAKRRERWLQCAKNTGWTVDGDDEESKEDNTAKKMRTVEATPAETAAQTRSTTSTAMMEDSDTSDEEYVPGMELPAAIIGSGEHETDEEDDGDNGEEEESDEDDDESNDEDGDQVSMEEVEDLFHENLEQDLKEAVQAVDKAAEEHGVLKADNQVATEEAEDTIDEDLPSIITQEHKTVLDQALVEILEELPENERGQFLAIVESQTAHHVEVLKQSMMKHLDPETLAELGGADGFELGLEDLPSDVLDLIKADVSSNLHQALQEVYDAEATNDGPEDTSTTPQKAKGIDNSDVMGLEQPGFDEHESDESDSLEFADDDDAEEELRQELNHDTEDDDDEDDDEDASGVTQAVSNKREDTNQKSADAIDVVAWNINTGTTEQIAKKKPAVWDGKRKPSINFLDDINGAVMTWDEKDSGVLTTPTSAVPLKDDLEREEYDEELDRGRVKKVRGPKPTVPDLKSSFDAVSVARKEGKATIPERLRMKKKALKQHQAAQRGRTFHHRKQKSDGATRN